LTEFDPDPLLERSCSTFGGVRAVIARRVKPRTTRRARDRNALAAAPCVTATSRSAVLRSSLCTVLYKSSRSVRGCTDLRVRWFVARDLICLSGHARVVVEALSRC